MDTRRFEIHVAGTLSDRARAAFADMEVAEVRGETVITGVSDDPDRVPSVLALIQSLGLQIVSLSQASDDPRPTGSGSAAGSS